MTGNSYGMRGGDEAGERPWSDIIVWFSAALWNAKRTALAGISS
jgi:hypothetical protein